MLIFTKKNSTCQKQNILYCTGIENYKYKQENKTKLTNGLSTEQPMHNYQYRFVRHE